MQLISAPTRRRHARRRVALCTAATLATALITAALGLARPAGADAARPHDPIGRVGSVSAVPGGVAFTGWAADPDALDVNETVAVLVDGLTWTAAAPTSVARPTIASRYGTGPTPGFAISTSLDGLPHIVCIVARNIDAGLDTVLSCVPTPLGTVLSGAQIDARNPQGRIEHAAASTSALRVAGWATDPDYVNRRMIAVLYVDGYPAATVSTHRYLDPRPTGAGSRSAFDITVPVSRGMHIGCVWVVNVGLGDNGFLGCRARDTRGPAGTDPVTVPLLNTQVLTTAKAHIGDAYVWGATGPHAFDCSGLVQFSYGKHGFLTPRVSEDQAHAARLIPAGRAVAGDLVFTHDTEGDVYHVGIFVKPGLAVAAIDTDQGVDYQNIWDPKATTYGSFTHI